MIEKRDEGMHSDDGNAKIYDQAIDRAVRSAWQQEAGTGRPRRASLRILVMLSVRGQRFSELSEAQGRRSQGLRRVELLYEEARSLRHMDPQRMVHYAELAQQAGERLSWRTYGKSAVADLKALTWAELGNAYRISIQYDRALQALGEAASWCRRGSQDPLVQAEIATVAAAFLDDQRRFPEAVDLLDRAVCVYLSHGDEHSAGRALVQKGVYAGYSNQTQLALQSISRGAALLCQERDPDLFLTALHNLLWFMVDDGQFRAARIRLWKLRPLLAAQSSPRKRLRLRWLEGRIYAGLGDFEKAEEAFRETQEGFNGIGQVYQAALVGMDLAAVWLRQGRMYEVRELSEALIATFRALRIGREFVAVLLFLCRACEEQRATLATISDAVMILNELEWQPVPLPAPDPAKG